MPKATKHIEKNNRKDRIEMVDIYLCVTPYHLYVTLLYIEKRNNKANSIILLDANDEQIYKSFVEYSCELEKRQYIVDLHLRNQIKNNIGLENLEGKKQFKRIEKKLGRKIGYDFTLFNFAWNCQYTYSIATYYIKRCRRLHIVEEGVQVAYVLPQPKYKIAVKKITGNIVDFYKLDKLDGIYVQKPETFPKEWRPKIKELDLQGLQNDLSAEGKYTILQVFLGNLYEKFARYDFNNTGIIYTQPLSEDHLISEDKKIDYYDQMVNYYGKYADPIIKIHPRDKTKYSFSSDLLVLPAGIPSEVFTLMRIRYKYAVAICSSAVMATNADIKLILNENFNADRIFKLLPLEYSL